MIFAPWMKPEYSPRGEETIGESLLRRLLLSPRNLAYRWREGDTVKALDFEGAVGAVLAAYAFLRDRGVRRGDLVVLSGPTSLEWHVLDLALLSLGAVVVPLYARAARADVAHILAETGARFVFFTGESCPEALAGRAKKFEPGGAKPGEEIAHAFAAAVAGVNAEMTATIVYTSGTSGRPKGVERTHGQLVREAQALVSGLLLGESDGSLSSLPLAHVMGRLESFLPIFSGGHISFGGGPPELARDLRAFAPTFFIGVPRIFDRLLERILGHAHSPRPQDLAVRLLADFGTSRYRRFRAGRKRTGVERVALRAIDLALWKNVRAALGGKLRFAVCGGAALSPAVEDYFELFGVPVYPAYGLTETGGAVAMNLPHRARPRTVGQPLYGVDVRLSAEGEVEVSGELVLKRYFREPPETAASFTADGWYRTGDIATRDADGYLRLVDRKKEILVTTGGQKVAPAYIEMLLRRSPFIAHAIILGDGRPFVSALFSLDWEAVTDWAGSQGLRGLSARELARHPRLLALLGAEVERVNRELAAYARIRKFQVLAESLAIDTETLTPSMKVRREACERRYFDHIEEIYRRGAHV